MTTITSFDLLRGWATKLMTQYGSRGDVEVLEPRFPNGALTVDIELDRTLAQVLLWRTGSLELRVVAIESGEELVVESHETLDSRGLTELLAHTEHLINGRDDPARR